MRKAYILTFDRDDSRDYSKLHDNITALPEILNWFHYVKSSYILISSIPNATKLNNEIMPIMRNKRYLLIEVNLDNRNGRLPSEAWEWIRKHADNVT